MNFSIKRISATLITLLALSFIVFFHELGHYLACHAFGVPTPTFSVGFGPALIQYKPQNTTFQIALIPLGGYVSIAAHELSQKPYWQKMIITLAGIFNNSLLAAVLLFFIFFSQEASSLTIALNATLKKLKELFKEFGGIFSPAYKRAKLMGPSEIITTTHQKFNESAAFFFLWLAVISIQIGLFNLLPLPLLDGGQAVQITAEALIHRDLTAQEIVFMHYAMVFFFISLILLSQKKKTP
ncbi:site-2 protease family protein [Candidatus Dependentiae bacterium]|nr:site-2 protease family protein [Candidatus Dependentiae bacterium]